MKPGALIGRRYVLERRIGRGGSAVSWRAHDRQTGEKVVLKVLSFGAMKDWKTLELFEREAAVLRNLHHDGIPAYVDTFRSGTGARAEIVLVQEYVQGTDLQHKVASGWRGTEEEIRAAAVRLLETVRYIHSLRPPVIHRDINPRNVILREDGAVFLVDFGGVQDTLRSATAARQTVIGTPGYMPLEQFVGRATVRSDLYACAATILFLLTHKDPQDQPVKDMKIDVSSLMEVGPGLSAVLDSWLEPDESNRRLPVEKAIEYLRDGVPGRVGAGADVSAALALDLDPPRFSRIRVERRGEVTTYVVPERGSAGAAPVIGGFSVFWLAFVAFWTFATMRMGAWEMSLFSIPFWLVGLFLARLSLFGIFGRTRLRIDPASGLSVERGLLFRKTVRVPAAEAGMISLGDTGGANGAQATGLQLELGARRVAFGAALSSAEKAWLKKNVNERLAEMSRARIPRDAGRP